MGMITPAGGWDAPQTSLQESRLAPQYASAPVAVPVPVPIPQQTVYVQIAERKRHGFFFWCVVLLLLLPVLPFGLIALPVLIPAIAVVVLVSRIGSRSRQTYVIRN